MYQLNVKPDDLKKAASVANTAKFNADVEAVLRGVERTMQDYINMTKTSPSRVNRESIRYDSSSYGSAVLRAACESLNRQGFKARVQHDEGYYDGPNSVHNSSASDYIEITL